MGPVVEGGDRSQIEGAHCFSRQRWEGGVRWPPAGSSLTTKLREARLRGGGARSSRGSKGREEPAPNRSGRGRKEQRCRHVIRKRCLRLRSLDRQV